MNEPSSLHDDRVLDQDLIHQFKAFIESDSFPCVGAKSALNRAQITLLVEDDMRHGPRPSTVSAIQAFSERYSRKSPLFQSLAVLFREPRASTEQSFERALWNYLQRVHDIDVRRHRWDPEVSCDPESPNFSFSVGERGYYVVGLHPGASRTARRFYRPALVFNLHDQFERLRSDGRYDPIRNTIVERDQKIEGSENPMLKKFGTGSEARQYSGRAVGDEWKCPFHAH